MLLKFGSSAMNGFCGGLEGVSSCAFAAEPEKPGRLGVPVSLIGAASAAGARARASPMIAVDAAPLSAARK